MADASEFLLAAAAGIQEHLRSYLASDGKEGYLYDMSSSGGSKVSTCLVLKTTGRKSNRSRFVPLLYAPWADEFVIVASKGGADEDPAWYLNLTASQEVFFQVKEKKFRGVWRTPEDEERERIWNFVTAYFPPYADYQAKTNRRIPVVVLCPNGRVNETWTSPTS